MMITGTGSFNASPHADRLADQFRKYNITVHQLSVSGEPSPEIVDETVRHYRNMDINLVIAIGGGSVMDAGKAVSAMLLTPGLVCDFLEVVGTGEHPGTKVPFIAVPTTSGTGSEVTKNAVISRAGQNGFKRSLRHDNLVPDIAIVDPELTLSCPPAVTAAAGMDCLTQLTEAYLSSRANDFTDALAIQGLKAVHRSLLRAFECGDDIHARSDMSFAALTSGICLANAGLGAVHGLAGTLGALFSIPHGVACGTLMAAVTRINVRELRKIQGGQEALMKYSIIGRIFSDEEGKNDDYYIDRVIEYFSEMTEQLNLPDLAGYGVKKEDLKTISSAAEMKNNPVMLADCLLEEILSMRL